MRLFNLLLCLVLFVSCDCYQQVSITVVDEETGMPLQGVKVYAKGNGFEDPLTDKIGYFKFVNVSGGLRCPPMKLVIEKAHYQTRELRIRRGQKIIKLKKVKY